MHIKALKHIVSFLTVFKETIFYYTRLGARAARDYSRGSKLVKHLHTQKVKIGDPLICCIAE